MYLEYTKVLARLARLALVSLEPPGAFIEKNLLSVELLFALVVEGEKPPRLSPSESFVSR